jgi:hypothetical protein
MSVVARARQAEILEIYQSPGTMFAFLSGS